MAIYDNLPYTNFHELNADWLLKQMKEAKAKIDEYQEVLDQFEEDYTVLLALANALSISGSNVTVAGSLTANGLIGNLTGNVTGNLTGNASTATHATTADSATTATNATNATHATSADSATNATNATHATSADSATNATNATNAAVANRTLLDTTVNSTDANDYIPDNDGLHVYQADALNSNVPGSQQGEAAVLLTIRFGTDHILQVAWFYVNAQELFYRQKYYSSWQGWYQISKTSAV